MTLAQGSESGAPANVTQLLNQWMDGDRKAFEALVPIVYGELRRIAENAMRREAVDHTLQPTALVNEAYLRLVEQHGMRWENRVHFYAVTAQMMRRILVDHARHGARKKRGGGVRPVTLQLAAELAAPETVDIVALDRALEKLEAVAPRQCRIVELRFFAGLDIDAVAAALGVSAPTVKREWAIARTFLFRELRQENTQ
jgi:RNA polymerase sigma factor (TIGR02999 family)